MRTSMTYAAAVAAAALAATAIATASWHPNDAGVPQPAVQAGQGHEAADKADAAYLPSLFGDEERAAPIEPLPPQF